MAIRSWHRGMLFRFILHLRRHHQTFRVGRGHEEYRLRGMSFSFSLFLTEAPGHRKICGVSQRGTRRCGEVQQDARRCLVIREVVGSGTRRYEEMR